MPTQEWWPDTCKCGFVQRHGEGNGVEFESIARKCDDHASVPDADLYDLVINGENRRKNNLHRELVMNDSLGLAEVRAGKREFGEDPKEMYRDLKPDVEFAWSFEGQGTERILKFSVTGADVDQRKLDDIKQAVDAVVGAQRLAVVEDVKAALPQDVVDLIQL